VDRRTGKRCKRPARRLSNATISKTITRLAQIPEVGVEYDLIARNPAKVGVKRRRLKASKPSRTYLDRAEQIAALLAPPAARTATVSAAACSPAPSSARTSGLQGRSRGAAKRSDVARAAAHVRSRSPSTRR
jgi:hypothetical protein